MCSKYVAPHSSARVDHGANSAVLQTVIVERVCERVVEECMCV